MEDKREGISQKLRCAPGAAFLNLLSQLGLKAPVILPVAPRGPLSLASMHISESFPQLFFFLRVLFLLEEKVPYTMIYVCLCRSFFEVFQRLSELFLV